MYVGLLMASNELRPGINTPPYLGQPSTTKNCPVQNINGAKTENPWSIAISTFSHHSLSCSSLVTSPALPPLVHPHAILLPTPEPFLMSHPT